MKSHKILVSALVASLIATGCAAMRPRSRAVSAHQGRQFSLVNISQKCHKKPLWIILHIDGTPVHETLTKLEGEGRIARSFNRDLYIEIAANQNGDHCKVLHFDAASLPRKTLHMSAFFASPRQGIILQGAPCHEAAQKYYQSCGIGRLSEATNVNGTELNTIITRTPQTSSAAPALRAPALAPSAMHHHAPRLNEIAFIDRFFAQAAQLDADQKAAALDILNRHINADDSTVDGFIADLRHADLLNHLGEQNARITYAIGHQMGEAIAKDDNLNIQTFTTAFFEYNRNLRGRELFIEFERALESVPHRHSGQVLNATQIHLLTYLVLSDRLNELFPEAPAADHVGQLGHLGDSFDSDSE